MAGIVERQRRDGRDSLDEEAKVLEDGLYYLGTLQSVAIYAVKSDDRLIVVNAPGGEACSTFVGDRLKQLHVEPNRPDTIWLTSTGPELTSGLKSFDPMPRIVGPEEARRELASMGVSRPTLIGESGPAESLLGSDAEVATIPIADRIYPGVAYSLTIAEKQVLLTPPVPRSLSFYRRDLRTGTNRREEIILLGRQLAASIWDKEPRDAYANAVDQLAEESPDIWLPALPVGTQSANLYDDDWQRVIADNRRKVTEMRQMREGAF